MIIIIITIIIIIIIKLNEYYFNEEIYQLKEKKIFIPRKLKTSSSLKKMIKNYLKEYSDDYNVNITIT